MNTKSSGTVANENGLTLEDFIENSPALYAILFFIELLPKLGAKKPEQQII